MIIDTENIQELLKSGYPSTQIGIETGLSISGINNYRTGKSKFENITLKYLQGLQGFCDSHHGKTNQEKLNITGIRKAVSAFNDWQGAARVYFDPSDMSVWTKAYASPREWDKYKDPKIVQIAQKATNRMDERDNTITMREIRELVDGVEKMTKYTYDYVEKGVVKRHYVSGLKYIAVAYSHNKKVLFEKFDTLEEARKCYAKYAQTHSSFNGKDLKEKRFGKLVALYPISQPDNKPMKWHCKCDCGNEVDVITNSLTSGNTTTCGATIHKKKHLNKNKALLNKKIEQYGTVPEYLLEKRRSNNQSGYKGVTKITKKNGKIKYQAKLTLARTEYVGKEYDTVREAYAERLELERKYFRPVLHRFIEDKEK